LPRFGEKSVENLLRSIERARKVNLPRFLVGLSIDQVGEETAVDLAEHFQTLEAIRSATREELEAIEGVGPIVAQSVHDWFRDPAHKQLVERLVKEVQVEPYEPAGTSKKLRGTTFVLTGTLKSMTRDEAKEQIRRQGGIVTSSVSKNTDYVVAGSDPGSKYQDAKRLGVSILTEAEFKRLVG
jgi:DNA ligase (NAD+)